jgi:hypothetical protein
MPGLEKDRGKQKLSNRERMRICACIAMGYNDERIVDVIKEEHDIELSRSTIAVTYRRSPKWKKLTARFQREADRDILKEPLAHKVNRIKALTETYNEAMSWRLDKINYDKDGCELSRVLKRNIGVVPAILRELRVEVEGDKAAVQIDKLETHTHLTLASITKEYGKLADDIIETLSGKRQGYDLSQKPAGADILGKQDAGDINIL